MLAWWQAEIEAIKNDSIHGATYLTKKALALLKKASKEELLLILPRLKTAQPFMASLYNLCLFVEEHLTDFTPKLCDVWWQEFEQANSKIVSEAAAMVRGKRILTHSFSSLVYEALLAAGDVQVFCTESRPKNEGRELAKSLEAHDIDVTLLIDAAAPTLVKEVDIVLFGADGLGNFGLVHKVGSYPIALAAREADVPVVALCPRQKVWPHDYRLPQELRDPLELDFSNARNIYFDITPLSLITKIIHCIQN